MSTDTPIHDRLAAERDASAGEPWDSGRYGWGTVTLVADDRMPAHIALIMSSPSPRIEVLT